MSENTYYINKIIYGGHGISYSEEGKKSTIIPYTLPGETVEATIQKKHKGLLKAKLNKIITPDIQNRITPKCEYFGKCGGCNFQHISYKHQVTIKNSLLQELYPDIKLQDPICNTDNIYFYRNKCEFTFGQNLELGMHMPGQYFDILGIEQCHLLPDSMMKILEFSYKFALSSGLTEYKDREETGFWQNIIIRYAIDKNQQEQLNIILRVNNIQGQYDYIIAKYIQEINTKLSDINITGICEQLAPRGGIELKSGSEYIIQQINNCSFQYSIKNFFQININLLPEVLDLIANLIKRYHAKYQFEQLFDFFAGVGVLGLYVAQSIDNLKVVAAESDESATQIAYTNAQNNEITNFDSKHLDLFKGKWGDFFVENYNCTNNCVIVDPPRAGMSKKSIRQILKIKPKIIVYMSCNPTTQQRDIEWLNNINDERFEGIQYKLVHMQLIDMFPQTYHLESLAVLELVE